MIFREPGYQHYLSYGATDQETLRELTSSFDGLVVPATVAAFQREGTGGFVLTLSATQAGAPYMIDPRFPLFQQGLTQPKKSHEALAALLDDPALISRSDPEAASFDDARLNRIAARWVDFNEVYEDAQSAKFDKYAKRLGEEVRRPQAQRPSHIIAPYFISEGPEDPWWAHSQRLVELTRSHAEDLGTLRVIACEQPGQLEALGMSLPTPEPLIVWVSGFNEMSAQVSDRVAYGESIRSLYEGGFTTFALYGGFFNLLMSGVGLSGESHGVGYGESRDWRELPQSGPPPARFYLPRTHRYVGQDLAFAMWSARPDLTRCECEVCDGGPPPDTYHGLMKHSVLARTAEVREWSGLVPSDASDRLEEQLHEFERDLGEAYLPRPLEGAAARSAEHLPRWIAALSRLAPLD